MIGKILKMKKMDFNSTRSEFDRLKSSSEQNILFSKTTKNLEKNELVKPIKSIEKSIKTFHHEQRAEKLRESKELKWKYASVVLDR